MKKLTKFIAVANQKGGVGKTTITFNLAKGLAKKGYKTLVLDNDPQANLTGAFLELEDEEEFSPNVLSLFEDDHPVIKPQNINDNLDFIGTDIRLSRIADRNFDVIFKLKEGIQDLAQSYDFVLIDSVPSFGYLNTAALYAANHVVVPVKPAKFALQGLKDLFATVEKIQKRLNPDLKILGLLINLLEANTRVGKVLEPKIRDAYGDLVFSTNINKAVKLEESPMFQQSIMEYEPQSAASKEFEAFFDEFLTRLGVEGHG